MLALRLDIYHHHHLFHLDYLLSHLQLHYPHVVQILVEIKSQEAQ